MRLAGRALARAVALGGELAEWERTVEVLGQWARRQRAKLKWRGLDVEAG